MPWQLEPRDRQVFQRNPLTVVIAQLRFHPILKVPDRISDFQERVRTRFPIYEERRARHVEIRGVSGVSVREEKQFVFQNPQEQATLFLTTGALALESRDHRDRDVFQKDFSLALDALREIHGDCSSTRLGLRYVNAIRREVIAESLGRPVEWRDLVTEPFLNVPGSPSLNGDTSFSGEVNSGLEGGGHLTLRYGLLGGPGGAAPEFRLDFDRSTEGAVDTDEIVSLLNSFADDIYSLFQASVGPGLADWMNG